MAKPKYKQGDIVLIYGKSKAKVLEVYPLDAWRPRQGYRVELMNYSGAISEVWEDYMDDIADESEGFNWESLCDCGSKYIYGYENCHSSWCKAWIKNGLEEK